MTRPACERLLLIMNPVSGQQDFEKLRGRLEATLERSGVAYEIRITEQAGDALRWAREAEAFDRVAVAGGDGTVMEAISGLAGRSLALAQIPTGTANLLAVALGVPQDPEEALKLALGGPAVAFDVGYLPERERYFALVVSAGWHAELVRDASRELKNRLGIFAYVLTGLRSLFTLRRSTIRLEIDGEVRQLRAHTVLLINIANLGSNLQFDKEIDPHDGKLDLAVVAPSDPWRLLRFIVRVLRRRVRSSPEAEFHALRRLRIDAQPPLPLQIDGETIGATPFSAEVVPDGALLVVPAAYASSRGRASGAAPAGER